MPATTRVATASSPRTRRSTPNRTRGQLTPIIHATTCSLCRSMVSRGRWSLGVVWWGFGGGVFVDVAFVGVTAWRSGRDEQSLTPVPPGVAGSDDTGDVVVRGEQYVGVWPALQDAHDGSACVTDHS